MIILLKKYNLKDVVEEVEIKIDDGLLQEMEEIVRLINQVIPKDREEKRINASTRLSTTYRVIIRLKNG